MGNKYVYLDYCANTPVDKEVLDAFNDATLKYFANPNSTHPLGILTKECLENKTNEILELLEKYALIGNDYELVYTSGASESNNLAIKGVAGSYKENGKHIISTFLEHSSVSSPLTYLKEMGYEIDILGVDSNGKVDLDELKRLLREDTILVSICYVDSEVGIVQDIANIRDVIKKYSNAILHVDATQAIGKIKLNFEDVDLVSFTPHKFYGINGFGCLLKKKDIVLEPLINGGTSTTIYRSGTPVIAGVYALEKALELSFSNYSSRLEYVRKINKKIREKVSLYPNVVINSNFEENPYILNVSVCGVKAKEFKEKLEEYGVCISIKSACSVTITPSRIVMAMTHDKKRAISSFRISLSHLVSENDVEYFLEAFNKSYLYFLGGKNAKV